MKPSNGPSPDVNRYEQVLKFRSDGWTYSAIGKFYGISASAASQLTKRARVWSTGGEVDDSVLEDKVSQSTSAIMEKLETIEDHLLAMRHQKELDVDDKQAGAGRPAHTQPPSQMWTWIVVECVEALGESGVADYVSTDRDNVRLWRRGLATPRPGFRDKLKELLATLWAREIYEDNEDLYDRMKTRIDRIKVTNKRD